MTRDIASEPDELHTPTDGVTVLEMWPRLNLEHDTNRAEYASYLITPTPAGEHEVEVTATAVYLNGTEVTVLGEMLVKPPVFKVEVYHDTEAVNIRQG